MGSTVLIPIYAMPAELWLLWCPTDEDDGFWAVPNHATGPEVAILSFTSKEQAEQYAAHLLAAEGVESIPFRAK